MNVAAADRMLPLVRRIVLNARARHRLIARKSEQATRNGDADQKLRLKLAIDRLRADLSGYAAELKGLGVELLDASTGLVGHKAELHGRTVTVTWRPGQSGFSEWYAEGESVADRRPLDAAPAAASAAFDV
jgi:hypothetical protein